jgi:hypothetical protein
VHSIYINTFVSTQSTQIVLGYMRQWIYRRKSNFSTSRPRTTSLVMQAMKASISEGVAQDESSWLLFTGPSRADFRYNSTPARGQTTMAPTQPTISPSRSMRIRTSSRPWRLRYFSLQASWWLSMSRSNCRKGSRKGSREKSSRDDKLSKMLDVEGKRAPRACHVSLHA